MLKIEVYGAIRDHKLEIQNKKRLLEDLQQAFDCEVIITIKKRGRRSTAQNRYLFGVVYSELRLGFINLGHRLTLDEVHQFCKEHFNPSYLMDHEGKLLATFPGSTTEFNKEEMSEYIDKIRDWASEHLGILIPEANSDNRLNF